MRTAPLFARAGDELQSPPPECLFGVAVGCCAVTRKGNINFCVGVLLTIGQRAAEEDRHTLKHQHTAIVKLKLAG